MHAAIFGPIVIALLQIKEINPERNKMLCLVA